MPKDPNKARTHVREGRQALRTLSPCFKHGGAKNSQAHTSLQASHLLVEALVPWGPGFEELVTVKHSVFVIQVVLHLPGEEKAALSVEIVPSARSRTRATGSTCGQKPCSSGIIPAPEGAGCPSSGAGAPGGTATVISQRPRSSHR